jgi:hypothetical protein
MECCRDFPAHGHATSRDSKDQRVADCRERFEKFPEASSGVMTVTEDKPLFPEPGIIHDSAHTTVPFETRFVF